MQKWGPHGPRPKQKTKTVFLSEIKKTDPKLSKPFYFNKIPYYVLVELLYIALLYIVNIMLFAKKCHFQP